MRGPDAGRVALFVGATPGSGDAPGDVRVGKVERGPLAEDPSAGVGPSASLGTWGPGRGSGGPDPLHPKLRRRLHTHDEEPVRVIVSLRGEPEPADSRPGRPTGLAGSPEEGGAVMAAIERAGGTVLERLRLVDALVARLTYAGLRDLLRREGDRISCVEPILASGSPPPPGRTRARVVRPDRRDRPACACSVEWVRERMGTEPYTRLGPAGGRVGEETIALLDTGIFTRHLLLAGTGRVRPRPARPGWNPALEAPDREDGVGCGHGTASAAILAGGAALGPEHRGVTRFPVDCYRVYEPGLGVVQLDLAAAVRSFEAAVGGGASVIVAQMQGASALRGVLNRAADRAYRAGAVVVAAGGNQPGAVPAPAAARGCLAMGAVDCRTLAPVAGARGPTADGRIKPDVLAFTGTLSASGARPDALEPFDGTSGATPYAGAAAALLRAWALRVKRRTDPAAGVEPGEVYALMMLAAIGGPGGEPEEAGLIRLPGSGRVVWGRAIVHPRETVAISLRLGRAAPRLEAAIWCGEPVGTRAAAWGGPGHVRLRALRREEGGRETERARGDLERSVFQKVRVPGGAERGAWVLRLEPCGVPGPLPVFLAARIG